MADPQDGAVAADAIANTDNTGTLSIEEVSVRPRAAVTSFRPATLAAYVAVVGCIALISGCSNTGQQSSSAPAKSPLVVHGQARITGIQVGQQLAGLQPTCGTKPWRMSIRNGSGTILKVVSSTVPRPAPDDAGTADDACVVDYRATVPNAPVYQFTFDDFSQTLQPVTMNRSEVVASHGLLPTFEGDAS